MVKSSGSILQLHSKAALSNVNLLIVTNQPDNLQAISSHLEASEINFSYDVIHTEDVEDCPEQQKYSAIVYDYTVTTDDYAINFLIEKLQWWSHFYPDTPLILITDVLGDAAAAKLIQSGVNGYVLRHKLCQLPKILKQALFDFASKQAVVKQQQDLIQQQHSQIQHLQTEITILRNGDKNQGIRLAQQHEN